jgi:hypothetical protein
MKHRNEEAREEHDEKTRRYEDEKQDTKRDREQSPRKRVGGWDKDEKREGRERARSKQLMTEQDQTKT